MLPLRLFWSGVLLAALALVTVQGASSDRLKDATPATFLPIFQPMRTEIAALSPDGRYLAYSVREKKQLSIVIVDLNAPKAPPVVRGVLTDDDAAVMEVAGSDPIPARIGWLGWTDSNRLVIESNRSASHFTGKAEHPPSSVSGAIESVDAEGNHGLVLATPAGLRDHGMEQGNNLGVWPEPRVFDFVPKDGNSIIVRATYADDWSLFAIDARNGHLTELPNGYPHYAAPSHFVLDQTGLERVHIPFSVSASAFPLRYVNDPTGAMKKSRTLDAIAGMKGSAGFSVTPQNFFGPRAVPVGFDLNPSTLYFASNVQDNTFGIYALDVGTGTVTDLGLEDPDFDLFEPSLAGAAVDPDNHKTADVQYDLADRLHNADSPLVFDRYTRALAGVRYHRAVATAKWLDGDLAAAQARLEEALPNRDIDILGWDRARQRFLFRTQSPGDPGGYYLYDAKSVKIVSQIRRLPGTKAPEQVRNLYTSAQGPGGTTVQGRLLLPAFSRSKKIPIVVLLPDLPWQRTATGYEPQVAALNAMGFAVALIDGPGLGGFGLSQLGPVDGGYLQRRSDAIRVWLQSLQGRPNLDTNHVAIMGSGDGATLALRLVQTLPDRFRAAIALNPAIDDSAEQKLSLFVGDQIESYLKKSIFGTEQDALSKHPEQIKCPVFLMAYPGRDGAPRTPIFYYCKDLVFSVRHHHGTADFAELDQGYPEGSPSAKANAFAQIESFLNAALYDFNVKLGKVIPVDR